jgi:hypothetical protein
MHRQIGMATRKSQRLVNLKRKEDDRNNPFHIHFVLSESSTQARNIKRRSSLEKAHDKANKINRQLEVEFYRINYPGIYFNFSDDEDD